MNMTDSLNLTLTSPVLPDSSSKLVDKSSLQNEQFARDFESIFIEKLLDEMKNTIGDWGFEQDGSSKQIQGLFWLNLARDVSSRGGLGLWKEIYNSLDMGHNKTTTEQSFDNKL